MRSKLVLTSVLVTSILSCSLVFTGGETPSADAPKTVPPSAVPDTPVPPTTGTLSIEIHYVGQWYRETFGYEPDAPNIRHVVQIVPASAADAPDAASLLFISLGFSPFPEPFLLREGREEYAPLLKYLYDAPQGMAVIELAPGMYNVAVAFIAAPLPPPGGDVILYPGVTGGGASNEFQVVEISAGKTVHLSIELTDNNGWGYLPVLASR